MPRGKSQGMRRRQPWLAIGMWVATLVAGLFALPGAFAGRSHVVTTVAAVEGWAVWGVVWLTMLVPRSVGLTVMRLLAPTSIVVAIATLAAGSPVPAGSVFLAVAVLTTASCLSATTTDAFVDGSSYGPEKRFSLRVPSGLALLAVPATWVVATIGLTVPVLLAARVWIAAAGALVIAAVAGRYAVRSIHGLSNRWIVFVPAGMVIHDPLTLDDAVLIARRSVHVLGPALANTDATDLSKGTFGLALQVDVEEPIELAVRRNGRGKPDEVTTSRVVFTPLRPGALLESARSNRIPIGVPSATPPPDHACGVDAPEEPEVTQTAVPLPRTRSPR